MSAIADKTAEESEMVVKRLNESDSNLNDFMHDDFKTDTYAMQIVKSSVVDDVLEQLNGSINLLNNELHQQIR